MSSSNSPDFDAEFAALMASLLELETVVDRLIETLPPERREFFLRLMVALDVEERSPLLPMILGLQLYAEYLKKVISVLLHQLPTNIKTAGDAAANRVLTSYGTIQSQIDVSVEQVRSEVTRIGAIRDQWNSNANELLPKLESAFTTAKDDAIKAYKAEIDTIAEDTLKDWADNYSATRQECLRQVWRMSAMAIGLGGLAIGVAAYFGGVQQGRAAAVQDSYKAFGGAENYEFTKYLVRRGDNVQRFVKCQKDGNDKCTVWISTPQQ